ncbi:hypothetical protein DNK57_02000 [Methanothermobacter thermautotrophicus]|uniref:Uncharacterized protein n=1 Tax=Methanothermobacter thermautotrophicus TaxID=145262 RepID=A0A842YNQ7_METTF|nr:hypothetical protein [Methanothermobacter thermautotrophicus]MBE2899603.1 hypothetical protein [Methanothermobacter thermautotrophicus]
MEDIKRGDALILRIRKDVKEVLETLPVAVQGMVYLPKHLQSSLDVQAGDMIDLEIETIKSRKRMKDDGC